MNLFNRTGIAVLTILVSTPAAADLQGSRIQFKDSMRVDVTEARKVSDSPLSADQHSSVYLQAGQPPLSREAALQSIRMDQAYCRIDAPIGVVSRATSQAPAVPLSAQPVFFGIQRSGDASLIATGPANEFHQKEKLESRWKPRQGSFTEIQLPTFGQNLASRIICFKKGSKAPSEPEIRRILAIGADILPPLPKTLSCPEGQTQVADGSCVIPGNAKSADGKEIYAKAQISEFTDEDVTGKAPAIRRESFSDEEAGKLEGNGLEPQPIERADPLKLMCDEFRHDPAAYEKCVMPAPKASPRPQVAKVNQTPVPTASPAPYDPCGRTQRVGLGSGVVANRPGVVMDGHISMRVMSCDEVRFDLNGGFNSDGRIVGKTSVQLQTDQRKPVGLFVRFADFNRDQHFLTNDYFNIGVAANWDGGQAGLGFSPLTLMYYDPTTPEERKFIAGRTARLFLNQSLGPKAEMSLNIEGQSAESHEVTRELDQAARAVGIGEVRYRVGEDKYIGFLGSVTGAHIKNIRVQPDASATDYSGIVVFGGGSIR